MHKFFVNMTLAMVVAFLVAIMAACGAFTSTNSQVESNADYPYAREVVLQMIMPVYVNQKDGWQETTIDIGQGGWQTRAQFLKKPNLFSEGFLFVVKPIKQLGEEEVIFVVGGHANNQGVALAMWYQRYLPFTSVIFVTTESQGSPPKGSIDSLSHPYTSGNKSLYSDTRSFGNQMISRRFFPLGSETSATLLNDAESIFQQLLTYCGRPDAHCYE